MNDLLIIIPAHNEEMNIKDVINEIASEMSFADILIVNDCSTDGTLSILRNLQVKYLSLPFNLGYSGALQAGFKYAVENHYKYVMQYDGDGQHIAAEGKSMFESFIKDNCDIVIGSRFKDKSEYKHSFFRKIGTNFFKVIIKKVCKTEICDPTSGFQVLSRRVFERYAKMNNYPEYPDANLIIEMLFEGFKIVEIQVKMRERLFGVSMHNGIIKPAKYMIKMFYAIMLIMLKNSTRKIKTNTLISIEKEISYD